MMDPVNKWLTVIILFMVGIIAMLWAKGEVGRYEFKVAESQYFEKTAVVYVLDTKEGKIYGHMVPEQELVTGAGKPSYKAVEVFEVPSTFNQRRY